MKPLTCVLAAIIAIAGCKSPTEAPQDVAQIVVTPDAMTLDRGASQSLVVSVLRSDGAPLPKLGLAYASDAPTVASVSTDGVVRAVAKGQATITVVRESVRANVTITVTDTGAAMPVYLSIGPVALNLWTGDTVQATAIVRNKWTEPLPDFPVTWTSSAPEVVTVSAGGFVRAQSPGAATLTVTAQHLRRTMAVVVQDTATTMEGTDRLIPGADAQLSLWAFDRAARRMQDYAAQWVSSDPDVASIDAHGVVTGLRNGTVTISGTAGSRSAQHVIAVGPLEGTIAYRATGNLVSFLGLDGSTAATRTIDSRAIGTIALSPDGNKLAYECASAVCLRDMNEKSVSVLLSSASDPSWTADGRTIGVRRGGLLSTVSLDGSVLQTVNTRQYAQGARIEANGSGFSFQCNLDDIYDDPTTVCFATLGQTGLYTIVSGASNFAWSPTRGMVAFVDEFGSYPVGYRPRLCVAPVNAPQCDISVRRQCWNDATQPAWSPDGAFFVFVKTGTLWIGDATGNVCMRLPRAITDRAILTSPTWGGGTVPPL